MSIRTVSSIKSISSPFIKTNSIRQYSANGILPSIIANFSKDVFFLDTSS